MAAKNHRKPHLARLNLLLPLAAMLLHAECLAGSSESFPEARSQADRPSPPPRIKAYYTRLPFDDHGFTGKYADIVVELPHRGQCIFSREFGYQPYWLPVGGKRESVAWLIPRKGDGPDERPDNHNIACSAAIVAQTDASVTVHWRYAPGITTLSFTDCLAAYNHEKKPGQLWLKRFNISSSLCWAP